MEGYFVESKGVKPPVYRGVAVVTDEDVTAILTVKTDARDGEEASFSDVAGNC